MRILLLNPPAEGLALRDYYCSTLSKADYVWHPVDLLAQSGILSASHDVSVLDAVAEGLDESAAFRRVSSFQPEAIFALVSASTWRKDLAFLERLKARRDATIILSGEVFMDDPAAVLDEYPVIDAALLNFTCGDLKNYLGGVRDKMSHFAWRSGGRIKVANKKAGGAFSYPVPRHDLFPMARYRMPWQLRHPFATVLTDFGCPFGCKFCNSRAFGYATRDIPNLADELDSIKSMGIRQLFIKDMTFGAVKSHGMAVLNLLIERNYGFSWNAYSRADVLDEEMAELMSRAGCHLAQIGVESADEGLMKKYGKGVSVEQTRAAFKLLKRHNIEAGAHFILGLPGDAIDSIRGAVDLAIELDPVYASFNVAMPRLGADLQSDGWRERPLDSSREKPFYTLDSIDPSRLLEERRRAVKKFYLRPRYWLRAIRAARSARQFMDGLNQAGALIKGMIKP